MMHATTPNSTTARAITGSVSFLERRLKTREPRARPTKNASRIKEKEIKYGNIAILLRTRTHLSDVEEQLRNYRIPFKTIGGIGFYQRQEIYDLYHLIKFIINPNDDLSAVGILRSPLVQISDEALTIIALQPDHTSCWQRLQKIDEIYHDANKVHSPLPSHAKGGKKGESESPSISQRKSPNNFQANIRNISMIDHMKIKLFVKKQIAG